MLSAYIIIGCLLLLLVVFFDKDDPKELENYKLIITCICIILLWPILLHLICKDIEIKR